MKRSRSSLGSLWFDLAINSIELMQGSATVIGKRSKTMAAAGIKPTRANDREIKRMIDEKVEASAASLMNMAFSTAASWQSMYMAALLGGRTPNASQGTRAIVNALGAGMTPYQKAVCGNLKRLGK